jgi:hypothetical protein
MEKQPAVKLKEKDSATTSENLLEHGPVKDHETTTTTTTTTTTIHSSPFL